MAARSRTSLIVVAVVALVGSVALVACGGGSAKPRVTASIPPPVTSTTVPGPTVVVTPPSAAQGTKFTLAVTNFPAGDMVTFVIDIPGGRKFTGQAHTVAPDGTVTTTFQTGTTNPAGDYLVHANGAKGASATAPFSVTGGSTTASSAGAAPGPSTTAPAKAPAPGTTAPAKVTTTTKKP
jgi:hypothetical protein